MLTAMPSGRLRQDSHMDAARASPEAGSPVPALPRRRDRRAVGMRLGLGADPDQQIEHGQFAKTHHVAPLGYMGDTPGIGFLAGGERHHGHQAESLRVDAAQLEPFSGCNCSFTRKR